MNEQSGPVGRCGWRVALAAFLCLAGPIWARGSEIIYSEVFDADDPDWGWASLHTIDSVNYVATVLDWDGAAADNNDYDDGDITQDLAFTSGMTETGDGDQGDGGLFMDTVDAIVGNEGLFINLSWLMQPGIDLDMQGSFYNELNSFTVYNISLWNATDNQQLATSGNKTVSQNSSLAYVPVSFHVTYTTQASDSGDVLQIRLVEANNNTSRNLYLDNIVVTASIPEPGTAALAVVGIGLFYLLRAERRSRPNGSRAPGRGRHGV